MRQILSRTAQRVGVLSHSEIPHDVQVIADGTVRLADAR
jgi:flagellar biosynthesis component FlhA